MKPHAALALALLATPLHARAAFVNLTPVPSPKGSHEPLRPSRDPSDYWYVTNATSHIAPVDPSDSPELTPDVEFEDGSAGTKIENNRRDTKAIYLDGLIAKAKLQIGSGAPDVALDSINQVLNIDPERAEAYVLRGALSAMKKRYGAAIQDYDRAISFDDASADAFMSRGIARLRLNQYAEAMEDLDRTLQIDPTFAEAYLKRGFIYAQQEAFEKARDDFEKFTALDPANPLGHKNLGAALSRLGKNDEANTAFRKAAFLEQQSRKNKTSP